MAELLFYHLERARLEAVLPDLLEKSRARGWRVHVQTGDAEAAERLDAHLWTYRDEAFLAHGRAGADDETGARQPIWLSAEPEAPNAPDVLFLVAGAARGADALADYARAVLIFDDDDGPARDRARVLWKEAREAGLEATYWRQSEAGRWEKQG
ncbi:MAG: DNA polymerase III subunit chi [Pseudomonadota bacterium]